MVPSEAGGPQPHIPGEVLHLPQEAEGAKSLLKVLPAWHYSILHIWGNQAIHNMHLNAFLIVIFLLFGSTGYVLFNVLLSFLPSLVMFHSTFS